LQPLAGAEEEARSIAGAVGDRYHTLLIGKEATETAFKALAETHNIIHLATHGIAYTEDPLQSFVALSPGEPETGETENGLLTAREVAQNRSLPADLIVLSACQTGLGRISGDGMLGLSRAFLIAGARTVVVSQWSVSDSATKELMVAFYQNYLTSGNKAVALQKAMQKVRNGLRPSEPAQPEYSHPRYWAPFVLVGAEL
jgi:CHAT domain-containing protein